MPELTFEPNKSKELADELAKYIHETGFNSLSKNDFYDFVLYLLDKYSNEHFLSLYSNQKNAILLKVKPEKIKGSKLNIFLKYIKQEEQKKALYKLIPFILEEKIVIDDHPDKNYVQITIEDPILRFCLDGKMKTEIGVSPNTSFNDEIIVVEKIAFFKILMIIAKENESFAGVHDVLKKKIKVSQLDENAKEAFSLLIEGTLEIAGKLVPLLPAETIKKGLHLCFDKVSRSVIKR